MGQNPIDFLRSAYKDLTDKADADDRWRAQTRSIGSEYPTYDDPSKLPPHMVYMGSELPPVSRAPMYRPQTEVLGGTDFAKDVDRVLSDVPEMRGRTTQIRNNPTDSVFGMLRRSGFRDDEYGETNLFGSTNIKDKRVTINPTLHGQRFFNDPELGETRAWYGKESGKPPGTFEGTLAHEMSHVSDAPHGPVLDEIEGYAEDAYGSGPLKALANAMKVKK